MLALLQRVSHARVEVAGELVGQIGPGLLVLVGVQPADGPAQATRLAERLLGYRVFDDGDGRMNLSLTDTGGGLLLVPQFTLAADTDRGRRPSFTSAAEPRHAQALFGVLVCLQAWDVPRLVNRRCAPCLPDPGTSSIWLMPSIT